MLYVITGNSLLSPAAKALDSAALTAYGQFAESLLRLNTVALYTGANGILAAQAVTLQVNRLLAIADAEMVKSWSNGQRHVTYRDGLPFLDTLAAELIQTLPGAPAKVGNAYAALTSIRPSSTDDPGIGFYPF